MNRKTLDLSIDSGRTILQVLEKMDHERVKSLIVNREDRFFGMITIGDLQRAIIKGHSLTEAIDPIVDTHKIYATVDDDMEVVKAKMHRLRAEFMPLVSASGELLDVYYWQDLFEMHQSEAREKIDLPVVIMAGGQGTRLRPLTNVIPKPLIPLNEKTILELILDQFCAIGCTRFYMSVNYKYEILKYYLDNLEIKYNVDFFKEEIPLGTIGSVSLLKDKITTPFFVSNCDILIDQDYRDVYDYHVRNKNKITIVAAVKTYRIPYGVVESGENGTLESLSEKPDISYMINTGVYLLDPELIDDIPENQFFHITELIEKTRSAGGRVGCFPVSEKSWTDIGDWSEYLKFIKKN
ncbi:NTP transferase domain-containing protein [Marnyiella aurantia]|uniref:NTP transferase domain-containing protein n=1 Tax=Marnyiella aurantia TaxID=2758037 RepID=A0A7D7LNC4_9FLAO|nr:nucleotidyltransferase family protein [Marnyiella aurantia]MBA5247443.1 NTP transferase domain-containing protein [Marnyiella aurantia]QMS99199.1 NTP transferase domain-containing protein [Marnyiella aurantia]